jgi:hypothetical protein
MPAWFHRRLFFKMSQHNIACFRIYFRKNTTDFISTSSRMMGCIFTPDAGISHQFSCFAPFISWDASSLKSDKVHLLFGWFHPGFKPALSAGKSLYLANDYFIVSSGNQSPNSGIFSCIVYFKFYHVLLVEINGVGSSPANMPLMALSIKSPD